MKSFAEKRRLQQIRASLPEALDILALVMQAGLDFQVALLHYLESGPVGPVREELAAMQLEIRTGTSRVEALRSLQTRVDSAELRETARALIQGIELGTSLAPVLRLQAKVLRKRRALEAEKHAALAPIKLMFPLFVFIFPTIFVVLFGPVVLSMMRGHG